MATENCTPQNGRAWLPAMRERREHYQSRSCPRLRMAPWIRLLILPLPRGPAGPRPSASAQPRGGSAKKFVQLSRNTIRGVDHSVDVLQKRVVSVGQGRDTYAQLSDPCGVFLLLLRVLPGQLRLLLCVLPGKLPHLLAQALDLRGQPRLLLRVLLGQLAEFVCQALFELGYRSPSAAPRPRRSPAPTALPAAGRRPARPDQSGRFRATRGGVGHGRCRPCGRGERAHK